MLTKAITMIRDSNLERNLIRSPHSLKKSKAQRGYVTLRGSFKP